MVNTGKPSRGCYMCRARRIKCDEGKPHCARCQKSKRQCPGYRDAFDMKLRDESKSTKKRLNRRSNQQQLGSDNIVNDLDSKYGPDVPSGFGRSHSRCISSSSVNSHISSSAHSRAIVPYPCQHNVIALHMITPIQQQAACYFLSNFVLVPELGTMRGYLDFVLPLMKQQTPQTALTYAFSAVTLAALGTRPNAKALASTADLWYLKALKEIKAALKDPKLASSDATLASVMLMASFEQLTPFRINVAGWSSHIDGAVAMIKSCPIERWQTGIGRELFIAVRAHHTLQCIANSRAVNTDIDWMGVRDCDDIIYSFAALNLKTSTLRADNDKTTTLKAHTAENVEKVLRLLRRAESLDQEYIDWIKALPASWAIKTVAWIDDEVPDLASSVIHPGRVDAYGELWMAYKYNVVRTCRLFIWTVILRCVAWLCNPQDYRLTPEYTTAVRICQQLIEDIVSSVPYFFGWNRDKDSDMADKSNFACGDNDPTAVRPLAGLFVMLPLFAAATSDFASPTQRVFLRGRLRFAAEMMGINQAMILFQARVVHPSIYIARERLNLVPTTCDSFDTKVKIISGVPSVSLIVPNLPASQDVVRWTASPEAKEQPLVAKSPTPPMEVVQAPPADTRPEPWSITTSHAPHDQGWQATTPPQTQAWQPATPPQELLWSPSTPSPKRDRWTTPSPPHEQNHLWSPASDSFESWTTTVPETNMQITNNHIYNLPISHPQDQVWHQAPVNTSLSYTGELITVHDPSEVWIAGFEDSTASWIPRTAAEHLDMLHGASYQSVMTSSHVFENERRYSKGVGV